MNLKINYTDNYYNYVPLSQKYIFIFAPIHAAHNHDDVYPCLAAFAACLAISSAMRGFGPAVVLIPVLAGRAFFFSYLGSEFSIYLKKF